jgi:serine/threonine protein phosphatase PrpC
LFSLVDFVGGVLRANSWNAQKAAEELAKSAFEKGSRDNITALIIVFFSPSSK